MDKTLNEIFEILKSKGIKTHYSPNNYKMNISVSQYEEIDRIKPLLKKYKLKFSFIDSANSRLILESRIDDKEILLNNKSMLLTIGTNYNILEAERYLNKEGLSIGYYFPPILKNPDMTFFDWIKNYHIPSLNYYNKDLASNIRGIKGVFTDGNVFESINAPRMATGSDIVRFLLLIGQNLFLPTKITMRIYPRKQNIQILSFSSQKLKNLFLALSSLALKNIQIEFATLYTRDEEHNDPVLEIGYTPDVIYDFKNWIIRTINNEGASLINTVSDYDIIQERLNNLVKNDHQIEIYAKYKSINRLCDILKLLSQYIKIKGYLYRYEKSSFSFRLILPADNYQQTKDILTTECLKYKGDIKFIECSNGSTNDIPLGLFSKIIHSCS